jgi:hypothetical protein
MLSLVDMSDKERIEALETALRWYVVNDETNEGGHWDEENAFWIEGKRNAEKLLGITNDQCKIQITIN